MKNGKIRDARLHPRPAVRRRGDKYLLTASVPTPARITAAEQLLYLPLKSNCHLILGLAALVSAGVWLRLFPPLVDLPFNWQPLVVGAGAFMLLWQIEKATGFKFTARLFYRRIPFCFTQDEIVIGRWPFRKRISRRERLGFAHIPIEGAITPVYQNSRTLVCVVAEVRRIKITEIYGGALAAEKVAANCNVVLSFGFSKAKPNT